MYDPLKQPFKINDTHLNCFSNAGFSVDWLPECEQLDVPAELLDLGVLQVLHHAQVLSDQLSWDILLKLRGANPRTPDPDTVMK